MDDGCLKTIKKHMAPHMKAVAKRVALTQRNEKIIERLKTGEKHATIAIDFGLSDNMVSTIAMRNNISTKRTKRNGT
jgi:FixJ family two-component response regulator